MLQISVIRTEGISDNTELCVFFDGKPAKALERFSEPIYSAQQGSLMRIILKNKLTKVPVCSGTYKTEAFPGEGFQWLPLSISPQDFYSKLPEEVTNPRVLVLLSYDLSPVIELSEAESEEVDSIRHDTSLHIEVKKMQYRISDLEGKIRKNEILTNEFKILYTESCKENEVLKKRLEEESKTSKNLRETIEKLKVDFEESKRNAQLREEFLESLINDKRKERNSDAGVSDKENYEICEDRKINSRNAIARKSSVGVLENITNRENKPKKIVSNKKIVSEMSTINNAKNTETAILAYMKKTKRFGKFVKDTGNMYRYGKKKIFITLKNGNLMCRVGGGFEGIDKFVEKNSEALEGSPKSNYHRRAHTASSLKHRDIKKLLTSNIITENSVDFESLSTSRNKRIICTTE